LLIKCLKLSVRKSKNKIWLTQQANIAAQADAQAQTAEKTAMAEVEKQEAITSY
jgi:hypothetical protein